MWDWRFVDVFVKLFCVCKTYKQNSNQNTEADTAYLIFLIIISSLFYNYLFSTACKHFLQSELNVLGIL